MNFFQTDSFRQNGVFLSLVCDLFNVGFKAIIQNRVELEL